MGLDVIDNGGYSTALIVIRPSLIDEAVRLWQVSRIIDLDQVTLDSSLIVEVFDGFELSSKPSHNL